MVEKNPHWAIRQLVKLMKESGGITGKRGRPKKSVTDAEKLYLEVEALQNFVEEKYSTKLSAKSAVIFLKWASDKPVINSINRDRLPNFRKRMIRVHKLTRPTVDTLEKSASLGKKRIKNKSK